MDSIKEGYKIIFIKGVCGTGKSAITKLWPEPAGQREVIISKVETESERVAREQGKTIPKSEVSDWLSEGFGGEEELVGEPTETSALV